MDKRTTEILRRFSRSWSDTESFFNDLINNYTGFDRLKPVTELITTLKQNGGEGSFRIGTSVHSLIISRSVDHGLRMDQKHIRIEAYDQGFEVTLRDGENIYRQYMLESLSDTRVVNLLKTLESTLVD
jgi:hypothetical protein